MSEPGRTTEPTPDAPPGEDGLPAHLDAGVLADYLSRTRWFGGKGRPFAVTGARRIARLPDDGAGPAVVVLVLTVDYDADDARGAAGEDARELYQVPLALYAEAERRLDHAFVGWWEEPDLGWVHAYDAVHDRAAMARWLAAFDVAHTDEALTFHRLPGHDLDLAQHSTLFSGEQSNSSVAFGEDALLKVFRKLTPGVNPDIEVHERLTAAGTDKVAGLYGWLEAPAADGEPLHLAMLQQFLRTASDGWDLALTSVRNLFGEADLHAEEAGGDFAGEAARLGEALREVHTLLAEQFGPGEPVDAADLAATMTARLEAAVGVVPALAEHADAVRAAYARVADLGTVATQRVHGDLHLGQTLRTVVGWKIVDFEGEPAKPLAQRRLPDSPWRDVAGMLRSFEYAPAAVTRSLDETHAATAAQREFRAQEWVARNTAAFLAAYAGADATHAGAPTAEEQALLTAYAVDKAVYETVYETRNRPTWVDIPLAAVANVARIGAA